MNKIKMPSDVIEIIEELENAGHTAYIVGGCVRDAIMNKEPHDYDICTSALPDDMHRIFANRKIIDTGLKHGTITVAGAEDFYEVTTYRIDGEYKDNRRPEEVIFVDNIEQDLARRDFTMNAIAYNHKTGIVDPYNGIEDISKGIIRCVGEADKRFKEDALRIMRAVRFASVLNFKIEPDTKIAMFNNKKLLKNVSEERKTSEFCKTILNANFDLLNTYKDIFATFIPEIKDCFYFEQHNYHHKYNVYEHIAHSVAEAPMNLTVKLALFFHDIGKPKTFSMGEDKVGHFYGHAKVSAEITEEILRRMKFDNNTIKDVCELVSSHDIVVSKELKFAKKLIGKMGEKQIENLITVQECDKKAQTINEHSKETFENLIVLKENIQKILSEEQCYSLKDLSINGKDIIELGFKEGKEIGEMLQYLLDIVIENPDENNREKLMEIVKNKKIDKMFSEDLTK
jgi:tRNA nucleotidyltransferase (CCA-adding enzyme)